MRYSQAAPSDSSDEGGSCTTPPNAQRCRMKRAFNGKFLPVPAPLLPGHFADHIMRLVILFIYFKQIRLFQNWHASRFYTAEAKSHSRTNWFENVSFCFEILPHRVFRTCSAPRHHGRSGCWPVPDSGIPCIGMSFPPKTGPLFLETEGGCDGSETLFG